MLPPPSSSLGRSHSIIILLMVDRGTDNWCQPLFALRVSAPSALRVSAPSAFEPRHPCGPLRRKRELVLPPGSPTPDASRRTTALPEGRQCAVMPESCSRTRRCSCSRTRRCLCPSTAHQRALGIAHRARHPCGPLRRRWELALLTGSPTSDASRRTTAPSEGCQCVVMPEFGWFDAQ